MLCCAVLLQILTYTEAVKTVDHDKALGKPNSLWIAFAKFYEKHGDVDNARVIFNKAVQVGRRCRMPTLFYLALCCFVLHGHQQ
jgi:hypothetical protein